MRRTSVWLPRVSWWCKWKRTQLTGYYLIVMDEGAALLPSFSLVRGALLRKHIEDDGGLVRTSLLYTYCVLNSSRNISEMRIAAAYQRLHGGMSMRFSRPSTEGGVKTPNDPELQPREFVIPVFPQDASPPATNRPPGRIARLVSFFTSQPNSAPPTGRGGVSPLTTDSSHQEQARENT